MIPCHVTVNGIHVPNTIPRLLGGGIVRSVSWRSGVLCSEIRLEIMTNLIVPQTAIKIEQGDAAVQWLALCAAILQSSDLCLCKV